MATRPVRLLVELTINEGKLDVFERIAKEMIAGSQEEPGTLGYEWCLSGDSSRCRLIETYADASAVLAHFTGPVVQKLVPMALEHSKIDRFQVYGDPRSKGGSDARGFWRGNLRALARFHPLSVLSW